MFIDARIPLRFAPLDDRAPDDAIVTDSRSAAPAPMARFEPESATGHPVDCTCCQPRTGAALALAALFRDRALTSGPAFKRVLAVVTPGGEAAIRAALASDPLVSARYRLA